MVSMLDNINSFKDLKSFWTDFNLEESRLCVLKLNIIIITNANIITIVSIPNSGDNTYIIAAKKTEKGASIITQIFLAEWFFVIIV